MLDAATIMSLLPGLPEGESKEAIYFANIVTEKFDLLGESEKYYLKIVLDKLLANETDEQLCVPRETLENL